MIRELRRAIILISLLAVVTVGLHVYSRTLPVSGETMRTFSSFEELREFLINKGSTPSKWSGVDRSMALEDATGSAPQQSRDYSETNVQVAGVDEADVVKTDGDYIYLASDTELIIVLAYPPEQARVVSRIALGGSLLGIFLDGDRLALFVAENSYVNSSKGSSRLMAPESGYYYSNTIAIRVYDISDRTAPTLAREVSMEGSYVASRMIGSFIYLLVASPAWQYTMDSSEVVLPKIAMGDKVIEVAATDIYYPDVKDYYSSYTTVLALDLSNDTQEPAHRTLLLGYTSTIYVSLDNIYTTYSIYGKNGAERTSIHRIHIDGLGLDYNGSGEVPGRVLNQFSMDEHNGFFRIAATSGGWGEGQRSNVYVLDKELKTVGALENLAPGESIYSARFAGSRAYLVTFKKVDPFFVIDLADPYQPKVLGELKITGYSDYLQPYDETHVIGIGKEAEAAVEGNFAWYQGVKVSLFDVTDVAAPKEIAKYEIGDRGTDSPALHDHKAVLFDASRNLLVLPVLVAKINPADYPSPMPSWAYGRYTWQGAYVFDISLEGLALRGRITHQDDQAALGKYYPGYYPWDHSVKRSLYIENALYTISDARMKVNDLNTLELLNDIVLSST